MASSSTSRTNNAIIEGSKKYPYPSHVNPVGFMSVKLSSKLNYQLWEEQMMCLLESHDMLGFIDGTLKNPHENNCKEDATDFEAMYREWKRSDTLVKGWIFGSLSENVMATVLDLKTAKEVWDKLKTTYTASPTPPPTTIAIAEKDVGVYVPLCIAIQNGNWMETKRILKENKEALTDKINYYGERTLHVAIGNPRNILILQNLVDMIEDPKILLDMVDNKKKNALHYAAGLDNTKAAEKLVEKNSDLLFTVDDKNCLPIERAIANSHIKTFHYLFEACKRYFRPDQNQLGLRNPFGGKHGVTLLDETIFSGILDVAYELLNKYPKLATTKVADLKTPLYHIAKKSDAYVSAKRYNSYQKFIYSRVPVENYNLDNTNNKMDIENQDTNMANLNGVLERIYDKFWKVALLYVQHVKDLHDDKVKHNTAIKILEFICDEVGKLKSDQDEHYQDAFIVAVENNTSEVLKMITRFFPQSIWTTDDIYEFTLPQLSIIYRCENAYNFFVHEVTQHKYLHNRRFDKNNNNLLHLAGRLAPTDKLNMVTGAALQMQREFQWFQEVKKICDPARGNRRTMKTKHQLWCLEKNTRI